MKFPASKALSGTYFDVAEKIVHTVVRCEGLRYSSHISCLESTGNGQAGSRRARRQVPKRGKNGLPRSRCGKVPVYNHP